MKLLSSLALFLAAFLAASEAVTIDCQYFLGGWFYMGHDIYTCQMLNKNDYPRGQTTITEVEGRHKSGKNANAVQGFISMHTASITKIPLGLDKLFKNLHSIRIANSLLKDVTKEDLRSYPKLKGLYLHNNRIEVIRNDLFQYTPSLEIVYLENNQISYIPPNTFGSLSHLRVLMLSYNKCFDFHGFADTREKSLALIGLIDEGACNSPPTDNEGSESKIVTTVVGTGTGVGVGAGGNGGETCEGLSEKIDKLIVEVTKLSRQQGQCACANEISEFSTLLRQRTGR